MEFDAEEIVVSALTPSGYQISAEVPIGEARLLRIGGRGAISSTQGGGWMGGGFGVQGILEGALLATAMNAMSTRTTMTIETFVHFNAGRRELMLVNRAVTPDVLQVQLAPVFARLEAASEIAATQDPPTDGSNQIRIDQLKQLGELRASSVLTEEEFSAEKTRLLGK